MIVIVPILSLTISAVLFLRYRRVQEELAHLIRRLRDTVMYRRLYPLLKRSVQQGLEEVYLCPKGICFRTMTPAPEVRWFMFAREGFDALTEDTMAVLIHALAVDAECLGHRELYVLEQGEQEIGEERYTWYAYQLLPHCKDRCFLYYRIKEQDIRRRVQNGI